MRVTESTTPDEPMGSEAPKNWMGITSCWVVNLTGYQLTSVKVGHTLKGTTDTLDIPGLNPNEHADLQLHVGSGGSDFWSVFVESAYEGSMGRKKLQCDIGWYDTQFYPPQVYFIIGTRRAGFSIQLPASDSSWGNAYG